MHRRARARAPAPYPGNSHAKADCSRPGRPGQEGPGPRRLQRPADRRSGEVADDRRIRAALPTLNDILQRGGSLILVSHLGRPTGDPAADAPFRMDQVAARLEQLIGRPVKKTD